MGLGVSYTFTATSARFMRYGNKGLRYRRWRSKAEDWGLQPSPLYSDSNLLVPETVGPSKPFQNRPARMKFVHSRQVMSPALGNILHFRLHGGEGPSRCRPNPLHHFLTVIVRMEDNLRTDHAGPDMGDSPYRHSASLVFSKEREHFFSHLDRVEAFHYHDWI